MVAASVGSDTCLRCKGTVSSIQQSWEVIFLCASLCLLLGVPVHPQGVKLLRGGLGKWSLLVCAAGHHEGLHKWMLLHLFRLIAELLQWAENEVCLG